MIVCMWQTTSTTAVPDPPPAPIVTGPPGVGITNAAIDELVQAFIQYGLILVTVATVAMAFLELVKAVTRARLWFHRWRIRRWIRRARPDREDQIYRQLLTLAASDVQNDSGLFDQSTDKMMGQIQAATSVAMDFPSNYTAFYEFLTQPPAAPESPEPSKEPEAASAADPADQSAPRRPGRATTDQNLWREYVEGFELDPAAKVADSRTGDGPSAESIAANSARARLDHFVARKLDAFQSSMVYEWARLNQLVAVVGSTVFLLFVLQDIQPDVVKRIGIAVFGGMIAPFAKDFVSALQRLRG